MCITFKETILKYLKKCPPAYCLFHDLQKAGDIYLIGGVLREYRDKKTIEELRDVDIIVDVKYPPVWNKIINERQKYKLLINRFDGYKICCKNLLIDTWSLDQTWAYRTKSFQCKSSEYVNNLSKTVFLNIDGIIYDWKRDHWDDIVYMQAMENKMLDIVLSPNPQPELNIVRAFVLQNRYNMFFSESLKEYIKDLYCKKYSHLDIFVDVLMNKQQSRYNKMILSRSHYIDSIYKILDEGQDRKSMPPKTHVSSHKI